MKNAEQNADRFIGFADVYDNARPSLPPHFMELIRLYLGHDIGNVVDLGCGTGLSTAAWEGNCTHVTGIEPSADMLAVAQKKASVAVSFRQGYSHDTGLPDGSADAVVCSQSFHWMEPVSTLREADRLLAPGEHKEQRSFQIRTGTCIRKSRAMHRAALHRACPEPGRIADAHEAPPGTY